MVENMNIEKRYINLDIPLTTYAQRYVKNKIEEAIPNCKVRDVYIGDNSVKVRIKLYDGAGEEREHFTIEGLNHEDIIKGIQEHQKGKGQSSGRHK